MDLHLTGYEILVIETKYLLVIVSPKKQDQVARVASLNQDSSITVIGDQINKILVQNQEVTKEKGKSFAGLISVPPLFFEQTDYTISIYASDELKSPIRVKTSSPEITGQIKPHPIRGKAEFNGVINWGNNIGFFEMSICSGETTLLSLTIEVFPSKITYKEDYQSMMLDINNMVNNSILDYMKKTFHGFAPDMEKCDTPIVFFTILKTIYKPFLAAINRILASPHHRLITEHEIMPFYKAKRFDRKTERWLEKNSENVHNKNGTIVSEKILAVKKSITYDTVENQIAKYIIQRIIRKTIDFRERVEKSYKNDSAKKKLVAAETQKIENECSRIIRTTFLASVSDYKATKSMSLVYEMAPGYRELYKYYIMLLNGLNVNGELFEMSERETNDIYEYWCFLALYQILKDKYNLKSDDVIKVDRSGAVVNLVKGQNSVVRFVDSETGDEIELLYNGMESDTPTAKQKPDNILSLTKKYSNTEYKYIFDAKYRIELGKDGYSTPEHPGPKTDDINTMHRYRDAIVYENLESRFAFEKTMFGGYVLFPYPLDEEEYRSHPFYKSINKVNIGGVPFLPGSTKIVRELLTKLIKERPSAAYERAVLQVGIEDLLKDNNSNIQNIIVAYIPTENEVIKTVKDNSYDIGDYSCTSGCIILWCEENERAMYYGFITAFDMIGAEKTAFIEKWVKFDDTIVASREIMEKLESFKGYADPGRHLQLWLPETIKRLTKIYLKEKALFQTKIETNG